MSDPTGPKRNDQTHARRPVCLARPTGADPATACQLPNPCPRHCGAKCRPDEFGERFCANRAKHENGRCRMHNGKAVRGPRHPRFVHGKVWLGRALPKEMHKAYKRLLDNPEVLGLEDEGRVLSLKERQVLKKMGEESPPPWGEAVEALNDFLIAYRSERKKLIEKREERLQKLVDVIRTGVGAAANQAKLWGEFRAIAQEKANLVRGERDWQIKLRTTITAEQAEALLFAITDAAKREFADQPERLGRFLHAAVRMLEAPKEVGAIE